VSVERKPVLFKHNCPVRERTADGHSVGRCWLWLEKDVCSRHGDVSKAVVHYVSTGELSEDERGK
jgi:hypothetical protein